MVRICLYRGCFCWFLAFPGGDSRPRRSAKSTGGGLGGIRGGGVFGDGAPRAFVYVYVCVGECVCACVCPCV